jgi:hypothetical protein
MSNYEVVYSLKSNMYETNEVHHVEKQIQDIKISFHVDI